MKFQGLRQVSQQESRHALIKNDGYSSKISASLLLSTVLLFTHQGIAQSQPKKAQRMPANTSAPSVQNPGKPKAAGGNSVPSGSSNTPKGYTTSLKYDDNRESIQWDLDFDIETSQGSLLQFGPLKLDEKSFFFQWGTPTQFSPAAKEVFDDEAQTESLLMFWPESLFTFGKIEMISRSGKVLWTYEIAKKDLEKFKKNQEELSKKRSKQKAENLLLQAEYVILDVKEKGFPKAQNEIFRFCLSQSEGKANSRLCSAQMGFRKNERGGMGLARVKSELKARVLLRNEAGKLKDTVPVTSELPTTFYADLSNGISYEFVANTPEYKISDILPSKTPGKFVVRGWDNPPAGPFRIINPEKYGSITNALGFQPTIGDFRKFWQVEVDQANPYLYFPGQGGGLFRVKVVLESAPKQQARPMLESDAPKSTYAEQITIRGYKRTGTIVKSEQNSVEEVSGQESLFDWNYSSPEQAQINRSYLMIEQDGKVYRSFYEVYRGFANEISGRMTGVAGTGSFTILAELAYNHWFESLFGWRNKMFSTHRWGTSAKFFQSLNQVQAGTTSANLSVITLDGKYRFSPGLWGRDETVGGMLSYQTVTFGSLSAPMLGTGLFWARSMPKVFDDLFNYLPFMKYPKWVDMEFIYYVSSLDTKVTIDSSMSLNFHGQVLWTDQFFGEAGFGLKRYAFTDKSKDQRAALNTFYGTVGLGYKF